MSPLRKNILIVNIKPHSTLQKFFRGTDLKADITSYIEVIEYIRGLHPDFMVYLKKQSQNELQETVTFLDKNLREITEEEMVMRKPHEGDTIYIVPAIVGGGGKRGILAMLAIAVALVTFPLWAPAVGLGALAGTAVMGTTIGAMVVQVGLSLALMSISMLLMPKQNTKSENSRDNDAFGSLVNTTASGVPVPLNYGLVRVSGQLISGYTKTVEADPGEDISLSSITVAS